MTNLTKLASVALAALVLSTAFVQAGPVVIGGLNDAIQDGVKPGPSGGNGPGDAWFPDNDNDNDGNWWDDVADAANGNGNGNGMIDAPVIHVGGNGMIDAPVIDVNGKPVIKGPHIDVGGGSKPGKPGTKKGGITFQTLDVAIACQVAGTPVEFPDDLLLTNHGAALDAGTTIKWKVKSAGQGYLQLTSDLPTGGSVKARGVLEGGVEAGKPCTAKIV